MAAAPAWTNISDNQYLPLATALFLLQQTFEDWQYGHLSVEHLRKKILEIDTAPNSTTNQLLYVWSYGALRDPLLSAFFFLRRRHKATGSQPKAYCMTVGAKSTGNDALSAAEIRTALAAVCKKMRIVLVPNLPLEVMHTDALPNFKDPNGNLATAFNNAIPNNSAPPHLESKGTIDVEPRTAWSDSAATLTWWNLKEQ